MESYLIPKILLTDKKNEHTISLYNQQIFRSSQNVIINTIYYTQLGIPKLNVKLCINSFFLIAYVLKLHVLFQTNKLLTMINDIVSYLITK